MGTWGKRAFDNDAAGDFADTLARDGLKKIRKVLAGIVSEGAGKGARADADDCSEAVAAAECIAAARGHANDGFPEDLRARLPAWRKGLGAKDVALAKRAVAIVADDSELATLWRESNGEEWARALVDLVERLERSVAPLPTVSKPKKRIVEVGDLVKVPLGGDAWAYGKVLHVATRWKCLALLGVYARRQSSGPMVGMVSMHKRPLETGDWPLVARAPLLREEIATLRGKLPPLVKIELEPPRVWVSEDDETDLGLGYAEFARRRVEKLSSEGA